MGKILIANVGNRTLVRKENDKRLEYGTKEKGEKSFKELTKLEFECLTEETILNELDSNIIDAIFDEEDIDKIYLFTSDQAGKDEKNTSKDTLYAGKILSVLLKKKYPDIVSVEDIVLTGISVVDLDRLVVSFKEQLLKIVEANKTKKFIVCDSGGTPQQKNALKIVTEYFLDRNAVEFYQVYERETDTDEIGNSCAKKQYFFQIRKIGDEQNILLLIEQGEYAAASQIRAVTMGKDDQVYKILKLLNFRLNLLEESAIKAILPNNLQNVNRADLLNTSSNFLKTNTLSIHFPLISKFLKIENGDFNKWRDEIESFDFFRLCEVLEVAGFYWHKKNWGNAILKYQVFFERFLRLLLKKNGYADDRSHHFKTAINTPQVKTELGLNTSDPVYTGIPANIALLSTLTISIHSQKIIESIKKCHSFWSQKEILKKEGIDKLRNDYAHEGIGIDKARIENAVNGGFETIIKSWHLAFGVSFDKEKNAFFKANEELKSYLLKY